MSLRKGFRCSALGLLTMVALAACDDDSQTLSGPDPGDMLPESQLDFVARRSSAPPLVTMDTSFWAVKGEDRELEIRFQGQGGPGTGKKFLEFRVDKNTLLRRPNGAAFQDGDSIEIFVTIDTVFYLANFEPAGLEFNPTEPAELGLKYDEAEDDFLTRETEFGLWRQENPGDPYVLLGSVQIEDFDEIEAKLFSFTRYALAIGR